MMIPLNSDTETQPTPEMRRVMASAAVGDEQRGEDPTVNLLIDRVSDLLGKEAALYCPSGTMCNLISVKVHTRPADVVITDHMSHIARAEVAGAALASGVLLETIHTDRGIFDPEELTRAMERVTIAPRPYSPVPRLLCVEQTHNFGGGSVWRLDELKAVCRQAGERGLATHMDGARLLNAVKASGTSASEFADCVDSIWIDFAKGLGAPVGAVLAGPREFIEEARRYKHLFGGAMRQAGIVAAGCLHALDHHIDRLQEDHQNAQRLAKGLEGIEGITVRNPDPESNMVFFDVSGSGLDNPAFIRMLHEKGVKMASIGPFIRAVTNLDVSGEDIEKVLGTVGRIVMENP
jgi:threonine aldolase